MIGFSLLGGRGQLLDALLLLLVLALAAGVVRSLWRSGNRTAAGAVALAGGGALLFTLGSWWMREEPVRLILLLTPLFLLGGLAMAELLSERRRRVATIVVAVAALNWAPIPLMMSCVRFFPEILTEGGAVPNPDGRFRAVIVEHANGFDGPYDRVVLRPANPWRSPTAWPERTVLQTGEGSRVKAIHWRGGGTLTVELPQEAQVDRHVKATHRVKVELLRVR